MSEAKLRPVEGADAVLDHLNGNHADSVLFLARHVAGRPLVDAELLRADQGGVDLRVCNGAGARSLRLIFPQLVGSTTDLQARLLDTLAEARAAEPDGPLTSLERELAGRDAIPTRTVMVAAVDDVGEGIRQLTFAGIHDHRPLGPDDFFLVIRPRPGQEHLLDGGARFSDLLQLPAEDQPHWAYYTCRRWRPEVGELDAWFVLHEHDGAVSGWARQAEVGDRAVLWGPRSAFDPPAGTRRLLLVGDETGLGAFAAILEQTEPAVAIDLLVECDHGTPLIDLPHHPRATVRWLGRDGHERGRGTVLLDAVAAMALVPEGLYAYGAGESRLVTSVRKHLRQERGLPGPQVQMVGYWRRGS